MPSQSKIQLVRLDSLNINDVFFDSLRCSYSEFNDWFLRKAKAEKEAYVLIDTDDRIQAFLMLQQEFGPIEDITPTIVTDNCLKVSTFKVNAHGTKLGERFIKKIFDEATSLNIRYIYVTVFEKHTPLIELLKRYGFYDFGTKTTCNGIETVFVKQFDKIKYDTLLDYPIINNSRGNIWLLSIYPHWHTRLFPDSILKTESSTIIHDTSETNSINKVYIGYMYGMTQLQVGDRLVIYRTAEKGRSAEYSSVATSICVVEDVRTRSSFSSEQDFTDYSQKNSVFSEQELSGLYRKSCDNEMVVVRMTYNLALPKRPNRHKLIVDCGIERDAYPGFMKLNQIQFKKILEHGEAYESLIIN